MAAFDQKVVTFKKMPTLEGKGDAGFGKSEAVVNRCF